jgi:hypothetical protein
MRAPAGQVSWPPVTRRTPSDIENLFAGFELIARACHNDRVVHNRTRSYRPGVGPRWRWQSALTRKAPQTWRRSIAPIFGKSRWEMMTSTEK